MDAIRHLRSKTVVLPVDDVDTDQIIPARFLTTTTREGLGEHLFHDWRLDGDGNGCSILGDDFLPVTLVAPQKPPCRKF